MGKGESKGERKDLKNYNCKMWNNRENKSQKRRRMVGTRREKKLWKVMEKDGWREGLEKIATVAQWKISKSTANP